MQERLFALAAHGRMGEQAPKVLTSLGEQAPKVLTSPVIETGGCMSETAITEAQLEKIGEYVRGQFPQWLRENGAAPLPDQSTDHPNDLVIQAPIPLVERIVRVEEALKHQTDFLKTMLKQMDTRFEENRQYSDKRFEELRQYSDKRFEELRQYSDKRFEELKQYSDKRFEEINKHFEENRQYSDKRFEEINKRFEENRQYSDKHFEEINKRFEENRQYSDMRFKEFKEYSDKRFEENRQHNDSRFKQMNGLLTTIFIVLGALITVFGLLN